MSDCIFCQIASGDIPSTKVFENEKILAFKDLNPQAEVHVLLIPKAHFDHIGDFAQSADPELMQALLEAIPQVAELCKCTDRGYRILTNCGEGAGQSVHHLHLHLLSDTKLKERLV